MQVKPISNSVRRHRRRMRVREWLKKHKWVTVKYWGEAKHVCWWGLIEAYLDDVQIDDLEVVFDCAPEIDCPHVRIWMLGEVIE